MAAKRNSKKRKMLTLQDRWELAERTVCRMFGLSHDGYLELWHELGCRYAEKMFDRDGLVYGPRMAAGVVRSDIYWKYWHGEWVNTCEWFFEWKYSKKGFNDFRKLHLLATKPNTDLLIKIVTDGQKGIIRNSKIKA